MMLPTFPETRNEPTNAAANDRIDQRKRSRIHIDEDNMMRTNHAFEKEDYD